MSKKTLENSPNTSGETPAKEMLTQKQYADRKGWSKQYVNQLVKKGRISLVDGKIDPVLADQQLAMVQDPSNTAGHNTEGQRELRDEDKAPMSNPAAFKLTCDKTSTGLTSIVRFCFRLGIVLFLFAIRAHVVCSDPTIYLVTVSSQ